MLVSTEYCANEQVKQKGDHACLLPFPSCHHGVTSKTERIHLDKNKSSSYVNIMSSPAVSLRMRILSF